jgi:hypothetical protein
MARGSREETVVFWRELVERQAAGDMTVAQLCDGAGVSTASFYAWKRRLRQAPSKRGSKPAAVAGMLVPVQLMGEAPPRTVPEIAIELPQGIVLRIPAGCDRPTVDVAVHAVRALIQTGETAC